MNGSGKDVRAAGARGALFQSGFLLACLVAAHVLSYVDQQVLSLVVEPVKLDLGLSDVQIGLLQGLAFSLFFCLAGLPLGWLVDHVNRRNMLIAGILLWSGMTVMCSLSSSFLTLFLARMGVGVGEAILGPAAYSMIGDSFRPERVVRAVSIYTLAGLAGIGLAFLLGGAAVEAISSMSSVPFGLKPWQATFLLVSSPGVLVALLFLLVREPLRTNVPQERPSFGQSVSLLAKRWGDFAPLYVSGVLLCTVSFSTFVWFPAHLARVHGLSSSSSGFILGSVLLVGAFVGTALGAGSTEYLQRRGYSAAPVRTVVIVSLLLVPATFAAYVADFRWMLALLIPLAVLEGAFYGNIVGALQLITPSGLRGLNSALFLLVTNLGSLGVGSLIIGAISDNVFPGRADGLGIAVTMTGAIAAALSAFIAWKSIPRMSIVMNNADADAATTPVSMPSSAAASVPVQ